MCSLFAHHDQENGQYQGFPRDVTMIMQGGPLTLGQDGSPPCSGSSNEHSSPTMTDDEYLQQFHAPSCAEMIPSHQVVEDSMSAAAKRRVDRATENLSGKRCLIENTDESNTVEYAHCLPRSTKQPLVSHPSRGVLSPGRHYSSLPAR